MQLGPKTILVTKRGLRRFDPEAVRANCQFVTITPESFIISDQKYKDLCIKVGILPTVNRKSPDFESNCELLAVLKGILAKTKGSDWPKNSLNNSINVYKQVGASIILAGFEEDFIQGFFKEQGENAKHGEYTVIFK